MRRIAIWGSAVVCCCWAGLPYVCLAAEHAPPLMHAEMFDDEDHIQVDRYWVSEKLDGVRAYWNGAQLLTRTGHVIAVPTWFTKGWPSTPLDGELWGGRGDFERTSGIVRSSKASDHEWRSLSYQVFDLPGEAGIFDERLRLLQSVVTGARVAWLRAVLQERVRDLGHLRSKLSDIESAGGEGLMLRRADSRYVVGRTDDLLSTLR